MSLSNDDLEDYVEKFRDIFHKQNDHKINEDDMWCLIDNLTSELELSKEREDCLQKNLAKILEDEHADITTKFVTLGEKCDNFEKENVYLKKKVNDLQMKIAAETEMLRDEHCQKLAEMEDKYKCEITSLKEQIENDKICHEAKEKDLYNELQIAQAAAALQWDEIESSLQRQLVDANNKLRNSQNTIRNLQKDINNLRNQLASQQAQPYRKPSKPEVRLNPLPVTSTRYPISYEDTETEDTEIFEEPPVRSLTPINRCSTPLNQNYSKVNSSPFVFRGANNHNSTKTGTTLKNKVKKMRKLYNPDSFDQSNIPQF